MLILNRSINDKIYIGDDIKIKIVGIRGQQIKLGIDAPKEISVHRQEIFEKILSQKNLDEAS